MLDNVRPYCYTYCMAHLHRKMKSGRPYYYIREIKRIHGKPTVVSQVYLGSPERILEMATMERTEAFTSLSSREFGSLFIFNEIDRKIGFTEIVDGVIPAKGNEERPSIGEYCYYAVLNRIIEPLSKLRLPEWYRKTDIQNIRPVSIERLNSKAFWDKWDKVDELAVKEIAGRFFTKVREVMAVSADCFLFDTTNYYTYLSSKTESDLAVRGHNKDGRHHLRQLGIALLVERSADMPVYYRLYPGNRHDSKVFHESIEELFAEMHSWGRTKERLTVVFDKGMNAEDTISYIDENQRVHFITSYSPSFADELAGKDVKHFSPLSIPKNLLLRESGDSQQQVLAYRTTGNYWGKERAVVVTYNPKTYRKKQMDFEQKLNRLREELLIYRRNYREQKPHWKDPESVRERYYRLCEDLHIGSQYYEIAFDSGEMSFRQHQYQIKVAMNRFGKNIIITDNIDWSTEEIYRAYHERSKIERQFRKSKSPFSISVTPQYHWTDSKIRLHILTCVVAMVYFSMFRNTLRAAGISASAEDVLKELRNLRTALYMTRGSKKLHRRLEDVTKTQADVLKAFGYDVKDNWVLHSEKL